MTKKNNGTSVYKVTGTVYVEAKNVRHAAHIAKGTFQMKENGPAIFVVEERTVSFGAPYLVNLEQQGHAERIFTTDSEKVGGTI